ncbi:ABC transporter substrate-binding protein [Fundidesulfovibrio agrisoli]|uniref:ABC transporter substrate-binding protein n=1 Tax=Fundidesulfovibrio agrisoli TaxID=2922717 RepID=UPI001FAE2409|nr:ABC transporter substrate-binding protein [Fundidesulfovibrio agrisoli]
MGMKTIITASVLACVLLAAGAYYLNTPVVIGFSGQLTGTFSDLGVQGRNGAMLAVELVNAAGGINGRKLKLLVRDDGNTPEKALAADLELLAAGAVAIVGHMTTSQTLAVLPELRFADAVLVSPTTASPKLTGLDDNFFRVIPDNTSWARTLAGYAFDGPGLRKVLLLGDSDNVGYTDTFLEGFRKSFTALGGEVLGEVAFSSRLKPDWGRLAADAAASGAQAVVLAASARDVAAFAQAQVRGGFRLPILCPTWPYTREILTAGGSNVEGIVFSTSYTEQNDYPGFEAFRQAYRNRFGWDPSFAAAYSYEAVLLLAKALDATGGKRKGLEAALAGAGIIHGAIGDFRLDANGDVERGNFIVTIRDGRFVTVPQGGE